MLEMVRPWTRTGGLFVRRGSVAAAAQLLAFTWAALTGPAAWAEDPLFAPLAVTHDRSAREAPDFTLRNPAGRTLALSALRGQVVFLNFWATWCSPCKIEMPEMEQLHREFKSQGLAVVGVDLDESPELVAKFMRELGLTFPVVVDTGSHVASRYRVLGLPTTVLIDRQGRTRGWAVGPREWAGPAGRALMRGLLERR